MCFDQLTMSGSWVLMGDDTRVVNDLELFNECRRERNHFKTVFSAGVGRQHRVAAGARQYGHTIALHQGHTDDLDGVDHFHLVIHADRGCLKKRAVHHRIVTGKSCCVRLCDLCTDGRAVGFLDDDGLVRGAGQIEKCPASFEPLQIQGDNVHPGIPDEIIQKVGFIELEFVAGGVNYDHFHKHCLQSAGC